MELVLPESADSVVLATAAKAVVAAVLLGQSVKVSVQQVELPTLTTEDGSFTDPVEIVSQISGDAELGQSEAVKLSKEVVEPFVKAQKRLDAETCAKIVPTLPDAHNPGPEGVYIFGDLYSLVSAKSKMAISMEAELLMWYTRFLANPRVQPAITHLHKLNGSSGNRPEVRSVSKDFSELKLNKSESPKPSAKDTPPAAATPEAKKSDSKPVKITKAPLFEKQQFPILPKKGKRNILITSALPYVNNVPHLGNIIGSTLSADFFARYTKARGYNSLYICGTDEYGTATETKAIEEKVTPMELCTKYYNLHKGVYEWFQIGFDHFGRTSAPAQTEITQDAFLKLYKNGYLEEQSMEQLYCPAHDGFLADRFVEGTCPKCGYHDARGDQCDSCGALLDPFELIDPRCKLDNTTPERRSTNHIFLCLDKLQPKVEKWVNEKQKNWSNNSVAITQSWLKKGLHPRAITRDLKWGVPVPLKGFENKVLYVWFDAPLGYPSITREYTEEWQQWWKNPDDVTLYQFMGKDNVPFHTVIFPATEIGSGDNWTTMSYLSTTEYLQYEGGKFSKSRNLGVFGNTAQEIGVSPSVWRYYLAVIRPETADSQFSWSDFVTRNNSELLANFGNFINRVIKFTIAKYDSVIPDYNPEVLSNYAAFVDDVNKILAHYNKCMEGLELREGVEAAMRLSARGNQFLQDNKLDNSLLENEPEKCAATIGVALNLIYILSAVFWPFMPESSEKILEQLLLPARLIPDEFDITVPAGHKLGPAQYLFTRIDKAKIAQWQEKFGGDKEEEEEKPKKKKKKSKKKKKKADSPDSKGDEADTSVVDTDADTSLVDVEADTS